MSGREAQESHEDKVARLTDMAEKKDLGGLSAELNAMSPEDRLAMAKDMDKLNEQNRASNSSLPDIELTTRRDSKYDEQLDDLQVREDRWGPDKYTDVYNTSPFRGDEKDMQVFKIPGLDEGTKMDYPLKVTETTKNDDGSTTEKYDGELDDGILNDTSISVSITRDAEGNITAMNVKYDPPMGNVKFGKGGWEGVANMRNVDELNYTRTADGKWSIQGPQQVYPSRWNTVIASANGEFENTSNDEVRRASR